MNANQVINPSPFSYFSRPKMDISKHRRNLPINPFLAKKEDSEDDFFGNARSKPRPSHNLRVDDDLFEEENKEKRGPFFRGDRNYKKVFKIGLNNNNNKDNMEKDKSDRNIIIKPNINIFICDPNYLKKESSLHNIQQLVKSEIKKVKEKEDNNRKEEEDKYFDRVLEIAQNNEQSAPPIDQVSDLVNIFDKLDINKKSKDNKERFVNVGMKGLGNYYMD